MRRPVFGCLALAGLSLPVVLPAPSYDPWAWLLWGTEVLNGQLSTLEGPAFKPFPVAVCTLLAGAGAAAPWLWVLVVRASALAAMWLAYREGRRLASGSVVSGALAAVGVALCGGYLSYAASGVAEGVLLALALGGAEAWRAGRPRWALACAVGCGLLRVETWPFLAVAAVMLWRRRPEDRTLLVAATLLVPVAWFVPEVVGSGDPLRSAVRARVPNPGQPALASFPMLASLRAAAALPLWPLWAGVALAAWRAWRWRDGAARATVVPAAVGLAWLALVSVMAQIGFSGEERYALPGAALVAVSGAAGLVQVARPVPWRGAAVTAAAALVVLVAVPRATGLAAVREVQAYQWGLQSDLAEAVVEAGGGDAVLGCGSPYVGPLRGPLMAYHLGVAKHVVDPDRRPQAPGVVFRSRMNAEAVLAPAVPAGFERIAAVGTWQVFARC